MAGGGADFGDEQTLTERHADAVLRACRLMDEAMVPPQLDELARAAGYSRFHFHRMFKALTGMTPHTYRAAVRAWRMRQELLGARTVSDAIYSSGFRSDGRFYAVASTLLGMTPQAFRAGGRGITMRAVTHRCRRGAVLVAVSEYGVCAVLSAPTGAELGRRLGELFPHAHRVYGCGQLAAAVRRALSRAEPPSRGQALLPAEVMEFCLRERLRNELRHCPELWAAAGPETAGGAMVSMAPPRSGLSR